VAFNAVHDGDVRMIERGERLRLPFEARQSLWIARKELGQDLDRDVAIQLPVAGAVDPPMPRPDEANDFTGAHTGPRH
jgi:hypothetical protein